MTEELAHVGFKMPADKKAKMEEIAAKNNRNLTGQLNHLCDICIAENEKKPRKAKK
jgi:hypothetical protein